MEREERLRIDPEVFDKAIDAHKQWKTRLRQCISHQDNCTDPATAEKDSVCALGQWIYGEGRTLAGDKQYESLRANHAKFHRCAGKIIRLVRQNRINDAVALLGSEYVETSSHVTAELGLMKKRCG